MEPNEEMERTEVTRISNGLAENSNYIQYNANNLSSYCVILSVYYLDDEGRSRKQHYLSYLSNENNMLQHVHACSVQIIILIIVVSYRNNYVIKECGW